MGIDLDTGAEWWWQAGPGPNLWWVMGSAAFGLFAALVLAGDVRRPVPAVPVGMAAHDSGDVTNDGGNSAPTTPTAVIADDTVVETEFDVNEVGNSGSPDH